METVQQNGGFTLFQLNSMLSLARAWARVFNIKQKKTKIATCNIIKTVFKGLIKLMQN